MPFLLDFENFPIEAQEAETLTCVPDCVFMIYQYLDIGREWTTIAGELGYSEIDGTPFDNLQDLEDVDAIYLSTLDEVDDHLEGPPPRPIIVNVRVRGAELLPYAEGTYLHAVVLVGCTAEEVWLADPMSVAGELIRRPRATLRNAWEGAYALILRP
jgi:hypothetical protein